LLVVDLPHPIGIPREPDLREGDEFGAGGASFVDEVYGLADAAFKIEPRGLGCDLYIFSDIVVKIRWRGVRLRLCTW
jgi:hypothetical protein